MPASPFETTESFHSLPVVRQVSVFLEDQVGALLRLFRAFDGTSVHVVAMSVVHSVDCAIIRLISDNNENAIEILKGKGLPISVSELVVVEVPHGQGLMSICSALLAGEVNINYAYPLLARPTGRAALAIHTNDVETAISVLRNRKFVVMGEDDLGGQVR